MEMINENSSKIIIIDTNINNIGQIMPMKNVLLVPPWVRAHRDTLNNIKNLVGICRANLCQVCDVDDVAFIVIDEEDTSSRIGAVCVYVRQNHVAHAKHICGAIEISGSIRVCWGICGRVVPKRKAIRISQDAKIFGVVCHWYVPY